MAAAQDLRRVQRFGITRLASDLAGRKAAEPGRVDAVMLVTRSGLMLQGWRRSGQRFDPDSLAAMMTAVSAFVKDSIGDGCAEEGWNAESFSVGRRNLVSIGAGGLIATAVVDGQACDGVTRELKRMVVRSAQHSASSTGGDGGWVQSPAQLEAFKESLARLVPEAGLERSGALALPPK